MKIKLVTDELAEKTYEGKTRHFRRLVGMGVDDFSEQFVEIELPVDHPPVGTDIVVEYRVKSVSSLFQGKARLQGSLVLPSKPPGK